MFLNTGGAVLRDSISDDLIYTLTHFTPPPPPCNLRRRNVGTFLCRINPPKYTSMQYIIFTMSHLKSVCPKNFTKIFLRRRLHGGGENFGFAATTSHAAVPSDHHDRRRRVFGSPTPDGVDAGCRTQSRHRFEPALPVHPRMHAGTHIRISAITRNVPPPRCCASPLAIHADRNAVMAQHLQELRARELGSPIRVKIAGRP